MRGKAGLTASAVLIILLWLALPVKIYSASTGITATVPLEVSGVRAVNISTTSAAIEWQTNGPASSQVYYGLETGEYTPTPETDTDTGSVSHRVVLNGLTANTTYYYKVYSKLNGSDLTAESEDMEFTTRSPGSGGGGGGGGGGITTVAVNGLQTSGTLKVKSSGTVLSSITLTASDGALSLKIPGNTILRNLSGTALQYLTAGKMSSPPKADPPAAVIQYFDCKPDGARFIPGIVATFRYDASTLPEGVEEDSLYIACWNGSSYEPLASTIDTSARTVSAVITHFSGVALLGVSRDAPIQEPTPTTAAPTSALPPPVIVTLTPGADFAEPGNIWEAKPGQTPAKATGKADSPAGNSSPTRPLDVWAMAIVFVAVVAVTVLIVQRVRRA